MSNINRTSVVSALIAPLALAAGASAQDEPRRTITESADGVYRATGQGPAGTVDDITYCSHAGHSPRTRLAP